MWRLIPFGRLFRQTGSLARAARHGLAALLVLGSLIGPNVGARAQFESTQDAISGSGAIWNFGNSNGVRRPGFVASEGEADRSVPGFGLDDADLGTLGQALNTSATLWINSLQFASDNFSISNGVITAGPVITQGVSVTVQHAVVVNGPLLRSLISFSNTSGAPVTLNSIEWIFSEVGGDENATRATSSGDANFTVEDRWLVSSDTDGTFPPSVPVVLYVLYGPGNPAKTLASQAVRVYQVGTPSNNQRGMNAIFGPLTIPAGATQRLLFFTGLYASNAEAASAAAQFNTTTTCPFIGIPANTRAEIINWSLTSSASCGVYLPMLRHP